MTETDRAIKSGGVWKEGAHRMILHELGSRTETEKETADTSKDNFRHQEGLRPSSNLRRDSQYPDRWDGDDEPHRRCPPRGFREDTVEFNEMSTRRQNQLIRTQNRTLLEKIEELEPRRRP
ncbi:hypothetical protein FPRO04_06965 [Fusarium proliferatum]|nr:hypothetical protein FPRO04_06965 [Fusarium proliferatum]